MGTRINKKAISGILGIILFLSIIIPLMMTPVAAASRSTNIILDTDEGWLWSYRYYRLTIDIGVENPGSSSARITWARLHLYSTTSGLLPPGLNYFSVDYMGYPAWGGEWKIFQPTVHDDGTMHINPEFYPPGGGHIPGRSEDWDWFDGTLTYQDTFYLHLEWHKHEAAWYGPVIETGSEAITYNAEIDVWTV
ncbi:MAG: hypothetical protein ACFFC7_02790 [Candidatus Hermodarchaeota archaeon]